VLRATVLVGCGAAVTACRGGHCGAQRSESSNRPPASPISVGVMDSRADAFVMSPETRVHGAIELMTRFAERTGLTSDRAQQRYLWTDAFAVDNFLGLSELTKDSPYTGNAIALIDRVHHTLGRFRPDDTRSGWLSRLDERSGEAHPTRGGLRIGKPLPERGLDEKLDERLEWDRDGQYFHYLIQWMHALDRIAQATGSCTYNVWARELADTAFRAFTFVRPGHKGRSMHWKMSVDLSRPLVASMGQQDPLDGHVTYLELQTTARRLQCSETPPDVSAEAAELASMVHADSLFTTDPLGLGGLLIDALRVTRLVRSGAQVARADLGERLLGAALPGLDEYARSGDLSQPASDRLAFRELGLALGLHAVVLLQEAVRTDPDALGSTKSVHTTLDAVARFTPLAEGIESFWLVPAHQAADSWVEHLDINEVMLATCLEPLGFFGTE
jgi:hypothetical protein